MVDRMVVFGGWNGRSSFADGWELSLADDPSWSALIHDGGGPNPRSAPTTIYDGTLDRMLVFAGRGPAGDDNQTLSLVRGPRLDAQPPAPPDSSWLAFAHPNPR